MRQLTALDAQFLHAESATTAAHVAGLAILDPACSRLGAVTRECLVGLLRERLHLAPALRLRLATVPFGLDRPYWTEDPDLDVAGHVHEVTLAGPGDDAQLAEKVARIHERHLDRTRPLWEMHLIHGLTGGRVALYAKVHHCAIDGVSGAELLAALLDLTPEPRAVERPAPGPRTTAPGLAGMLAGAVARTVLQPARTLYSLGRMATELDTMPLTSALPGARQVAAATRMIAGRAPEPSAPSEPPMLTAPRTPFNGPIGAERRFSYGSIPLADVKRVAKSAGASVNDVVMTLCASALRAWLHERDALPDRPLIAAVPVAVRTASAQDVVGNQISVMVTPIPTDLACPRERLRVMAGTMLAAKRRFAGAPTAWLGELSSMLPSAVTALATSAVFRLASIVLPPINLIVSNVPGPQLPLYLCGARVLAYHPMSVLTDVSGGVNITCFSYDGSLDFGILSCPDRVADVWRLMGHLREAMDELMEQVEPAVPTVRIAPVGHPPPVREMVPA
ncbi:MULTISPECIES: WS/DGAT/MGAT family O-acyltransferase [unclassified Streptosporangium]|uniref:WS/DGAT/MGAT family O-acyltransferase n=1 Tax=unclassified Streptosporangium TaxID=2632669 RepID=UPI002E28F47B|nr:MULTISPECIES: wax ester/triacylglycerol synthase family O-acyltransferase [unclassified Streptosporangium]